MSMILFADDSTGLLRASSVKELESKANKEIKKLAVWFRANKLALSFNKCNYIIFSPFPKRHQPIEITIKIDDNDEGQGDPEKIIPINRVSRFSDEKSVRLLGIYIDEDLNFIAQADQLISKLSSTLFLLNQLKHFLPIRILKLIYFAHFHSYLNYCSHYLPMLPSKTFHRIRVLQKKAIRAVHKESYLAHTNILFKDSGILPIDDLIEFNILIFMARFTNNLQPSSFTSDWKYNYEINSNYSLRNASDLFEVNCKNNHLKMHPWINFVRKWNNFKDDIKYISHIPTFKKKLKNKMISHINGEVCVDVLCFACHGVSSTIALKD